MSFERLNLNHVERNIKYIVVDVDELDKRRKAMGMPPVKEYTSTWNIDEYKKSCQKLRK